VQESKELQVLYEGSNQDTAAVRTELDKLQTQVRVCPLPYAACLVSCGCTMLMLMLMRVQLLLLERAASNMDKWIQNPTGWLVHVSSVMVRQMCPCVVLCTRLVGYVPCI
jgi:hypothetical protein